MTTKQFITTSIPYINGELHLGHALEFVQADVLSRWAQLKGDQKIFQSGTDENAGKNLVTATERNVTIQDFVDNRRKFFYQTLNSLNIACDQWVHTADQSHHQSVQYFLDRLNPNDVYRKDYLGLYCQGCEAYIKEEELSSGVCPDHLKPPTLEKESCYFFRLSDYQNQLQEIIEKDIIQVFPRQKKREVLGFIQQGLEDICLSRSASRSDNWGVPYPGDPSQVVYVWIDALVNYLSGIGFGSNDRWSEIWNVDTEITHVIGKNIWKFHAVYWPALLLSVGLPLPRKICVHNFLTHNGQKISKSDRANSVLDYIRNPQECDSVRYSLLKVSSPSKDSDISEDYIAQTSQETIRGTIANAAYRYLVLCHKFGFSLRLEGKEDLPEIDSFVENFDFPSLLTWIENQFRAINQAISQTAPWQKSSLDSDLKNHLQEWGKTILSANQALSLVTPHLAQIIATSLDDTARKPTKLF